MKVSDFITELGEVLQEDFVYAPLWTKAQLLGFIRQALREMSTRTMMADKSRIVLVDSATGEFSVPADFHAGYYLLFNRAFVDIVQYGDLEFASQTWALGSTATTPLAATLFGSGDTTTVRMVPVPSTATGAFSAGTVTSVTLTDSAGVVWTVSVTGRELVTSVAGASGLNLLLKSTSFVWSLGVDTLGRLTTTLSAGAGSTVILADTTDGLTMSLGVNDDGELVTSAAYTYGGIVKLTLDDVVQDISAGANSTNANYGILVDLYATGVSTAPTHTARLTGPVGEVMITRTSDYSAEMWYKAHIEDVLTTESEIFLSTPFLAVLKHGVLALAYEHETDGQDLVKAKLLKSLFESECTAIKRMFNRK